MRTTFNESIRSAALGAGVFVLAGFLASSSGVLCRAAEGKKGSNDPLEITVGQPVVVGPVRRWAEVSRWGVWNFPDIVRLRDGRMAVSVSVVGDSSTNYGLPRPGFVSSDGGRHWEPVGENDMEKVGRLLYREGAVTMPDGEQIRNVVMRPLMKADLQLPKPLNKPGEITAYTDHDVCYRLGDFPRELMALKMLRRPAGQDKWIEEKGYVDMPSFTIWSDHRPHLPQPSLRRMLLAPDGSLLAILYNIVVNMEDKPASKCAAICLRSVDRGRTWKFWGKVPDLSEPDRIHNNLYEPGVLFLDAHRAICVMRSSHVYNKWKHHEMYISRTTDMGRTWSPPEAITSFGVEPTLLRLENGVIVLSYGRPGVYLRFSTDDGQTWDNFTVILGPTTEGLTLDKFQSRFTNSCGYTKLLATGPDRFLLVYSDFKYQHEGERHKAILVREIVAKKAR